VAEVSPAAVVDSVAEELQAVGRSG